MIRILRRVELYVSGCRIILGLNFNQFFPINPFKRNIDLVVSSEVMNRKLLKKMFTNNIYLVLANLVANATKVEN